MRLLIARDAPRRSLLLWALLFVAFSMADLLLTWWQVGLRGGTELNPVMARVIGEYGWYTTTMFKAIGSSVCALFLVAFKLRFALKVVVYAMIAIAAFNLTGVLWP